MMGYAPDLHRIWVGTSDRQLIELSREFPGFYCYARTMEEATEAERQKASRPYDGMAEFSDEFKTWGTRLLQAAATLERGYQAFQGSVMAVFQPQVDEVNRRYRQWLADVDRFKGALRANGAEQMVLEYVNEAFGRFVERIQRLAS